MKKNFSTNMSLRNQNINRVVSTLPNTTFQHQSCSTNRKDNNYATERIFTINDIPFRSQRSQKTLETAKTQ